LTVKSLGFRVYGLGFEGQEFRVLGVGSRVMRVKSLGFRV
jgi:hypothetical protein